MRSTKHSMVQSLCHTPEINATLCVNYIGVKIKSLIKKGKNKLKILAATDNDCLFKVLDLGHYLNIRVNWQTFRKYTGTIVYSQTGIVRIWDEAGIGHHIFFISCSGLRTTPLLENLRNFPPPPKFIILSFCNFPSHLK